MPPSMCFKLLPCAKASRADVDPVTHLTFRIRTFNTNGVGQVAHAIITLYIEARLVDN